MSDIPEKEAVRSRSEKQKNTLLLRSELAQEIISRQGGFMEKWALLIFLAVLLLIVAGSWFIRYPDVVNASATLTAENAPKEIIPKQSGRLIRLFVQNGQQVQSGQMLSWIESASNTADVLLLSLQVDSCIALMNTHQFEKIPRILKTGFKDLGDIQTPYQTFITAYHAYNDYWVNGFYAKRRMMLGKDKESIRELNKILEEKKKISVADRDSALVSLKMNEYLLKEKVIAPEEYRNQNSKFLNKQMAIPQYDENMLNNETQLREKQKEIDQLNHDEQQQWIDFEQALRTLKSIIDNWLQQYVLKAPVAGRIDFTEPIQQNKYVEAGRLIAYVNPPGAGYYMDIKIPQNNFGKVDSGMEVQLRFAAYPYQEDGYVNARISYLSPIATDSGFLARAGLSSGLVTNLRKRIAYKNGLTAEALIITKDMRLLQRMYYNLKKSLSPNK